MLSANAEKLIDQYFNLPFPGVLEVRCPYFNNKKLGQRGGLRVLIGKGSPSEIVEECKIISIQYKIPIFSDNKITADQIRKFLIDYNIGIDCSGFISQVLRAHYRETKRVDFTKKLFICPKYHPLRWILTKLRPIESISVRILSNDQNSSLINLSDIQPGDFITMLGTGPNGKRNHTILIQNVSANKIDYVHARTWTSEGQYGHGMSKGIIELIDPQKNLLAQKWIEKGLENDHNETYLEAKRAKILEIRRIKI